MNSAVESWNAAAREHLDNIVDLLAGEPLVVEVFSRLISMSLAIGSQEAVVAILVPT